MNNVRMLSSQDYKLLFLLTTADQIENYLQTVECEHNNLSHVVFLWYHFSVV